jgi:membrane protease YdiL (CAAX protease family)
MKETFQELITYFKNPVLEKDNNTNLNYKFIKFWHLLIISIISAIVLTPLILLIDQMGLVNMDEHAMKKLTEEHSKSFIFILVVVLAPLFEELIFRAPITLFKNNKNFKITFFVIAVLFGLIHLANYDITTYTLLLTPILVAPQAILGCYLGFIRVRFGLGWSILLHACYNAFFMLFLLL